MGADRRVALDLAEEDIRRVLVHQALRLRRMGREPGADRGERHLIPRHLAAFDEEPADRHIGAPVLPVEADIDQRAVAEPHPAGALDRQHEGIDRIIDPEEGEIEPVERAALDLGAGLIGPEPSIDHPAGDALAAPIGAEEPELDRDEIGRAPQQRRREGAALLRAPRSSGSK